ncbi:unnamed protein product [Polarella glacialis]|uniref:Uncharacterized protein n=1 Tax=Polarella glacialis TaxID=89957 RepID=A0A813KYA4_POLGL|nr:unnamed protein product [Polarella glacialis]
MAWPVEAVAALGSEQVSSFVKEALLSLWSLSREVSLAVQSLPEEVQASLGGLIGFDDLLWARGLFDSRAVSAEIKVPAKLQPRHPTGAGAASDQADIDTLQISLEECSGDAGHGNAASVPCPKKVVSLAPTVPPGTVAQLTVCLVVAAIILSARLVMLGLQEYLLSEQLGELGELTTVSELGIMITVFRAALIMLHRMAPLMRSIRFVYLRWNGLCDVGLCVLFPPVMLSAMTLINGDAPPLWDVNGAFFAPCCHPSWRGFGGATARSLGCSGPPSASAL